ncbi:TPA: DNA/RNA non-specific endonuclease [Streptococcus suis]|nr:DNA/RNA non-specific endonuclease [Streptococcus suis]MBS8101638.1 DNA/RNA non-specific endonuclease [Streptococcus suis]MCK3871340.1 DNA/RNA non-specific endonuclease [Streptococcus suis]NQI76311.1 DNA/RNA non-specific endonuclease [Streptococcus suis]NQI78273.1 DNA/RNA non-specific endonuclease [Streptococcus suis]NQI82175.1 DNA/RNA non-specific endonuclease [Streptococcus suis]
MKRICLFLFVFISFLVSGFPVKANQESIDYSSLNLIPFNGNKQIVLGEFDTLGRATSAHIQLQDKDEPKKRREPRIKFTPVGWHNYKITYGNQGTKSWLFNRGHLIGYQFSGLTDEGKNLVPLTAWTNSGNYKGTDDSNFESMLYYENRLDSWLANHPHFWLDYKVTPIYSGDELIPRQISLQYVGLDESGKLININLGSPKESVDGYGITTVILDNYSKNATIDYLKGTATPSLVSTDETSQTASSSVATESQPSESSQVAQSETQLAPVVYIARNGNADVYWYSKENMPANTNFAKVIEMSEEQALSLGKRHTTKE